jgi:hypothetical protein
MRVERIGTRAALVERQPSLMARIVYRATSTTRFAALDRRGNWRWEHNGELCEAAVANELDRAPLQGQV